MSSRASTIAFAGAVLAAVSAAAGAANAQEIFSYEPNTLGRPEAPAVLTIPVRASVQAQCGFGQAPTGTLNVGQLDTEFVTREAPFTLACTIPSRVAVVSANGGLQIGGTRLTGVPGYDNYRDYTVELVLNGATQNVTSDCLASNLDATSNCPAFYGTASTTNGLLLSERADTAALPSLVRVRGTPPTAAEPALIQGDYTDTLTVTVSPAA